MDTRTKKRQTRGDLIKINTAIEELMKKNNGNDTSIDPESEPFISVDS